MEYILSRYGQDVKYIRRTKIPCKECWGEEPDISYCKRCYGTGREIKIEDRLAYSEAASVPQTWPRMTEKKPIGDWQVPAYMFYFEYYVEPTEKDLIIVNNKLYQIHFSDPLEGREGRVEYYRAATERRPTMEHLLK